RAWRNQPLAPRANIEPPAIIATTPLPNSTALDSSRERGRLPCLIAFSRRRPVGCSVFSWPSSFSAMAGSGAGRRGRDGCVQVLFQTWAPFLRRGEKAEGPPSGGPSSRSEERRVGKECRARWATASQVKRGRRQGG